jgi:hypothetical protein
MSFVNHGSPKRLVGRFLGSEGMRLGKVYLMTVEKDKEGFLVMKQN